MCPLKDRQDSEGYTLGEGLVDCSLLCFGDLLGHGGSLFSVVGLSAFHVQIIAQPWTASTII